MGRSCQREGRVAGWRRIVVIVDDPETSLMTLQKAVATARRHRARLTIVSVAPRPWPTVAMAGMCPRRLEAEAMERVGTMVRRIAETVPADVPCTTIVRCGRAFKQILAILTEHPYDLVFLGRGVGGSAACWKAVRLMRMARIDFVLLDFPPVAPVRSGDSSHVSMKTSVSDSRPGLAEAPVNWPGCSRDR